MKKRKRTVGPASICVLFDGCCIGCSKESAGFTFSPLRVFWRYCSGKINGKNRGKINGRNSGKISGKNSSKNNERFFNGNSGMFIFIP